MIFHRHTIAVSFAALAACAGGKDAGLIDAGATTGAGASTTATNSASSVSSTTTSSSASSGSGAGTGTTTGTSGTSGSGTTGAASGSSSGTASSSSGTTSGGSIGPCTWVGDTCGLNSCAGAGSNRICYADGGLGRCFAGACQLNLDFQTDPDNCGAYGVVCPPSLPCEDGECGAANARMGCSAGVDSGCPAGTSCVSVGVGEDVIRGCILTSCFDAGDDQACNGGSGFCCHGACMDAHPVTPDPDNCGGCGVACGMGSACAGTECVPWTSCTANDDGSPCPLSGTLGTCCAGVCVAVSSPDICAGCGWLCTCDGGCPDGSICTSDDSCAPVECGTGSDGIGCLSDPDAGIDGICCAGSCTQTWLDPNNCGICGRSCASGDTCIYGECGSPSACQVTGDLCLLDGGPFGTCCGNRCVDLTADHDNCGSCDFGCPTGSSCGQSSCVNDAGAVQCTQDSDCAPNRACSSVLYYGGSYCIPRSCDAGTFFCQLSGDAGGGFCCGSACVDLTSDSANCDGCGYTCPSGLACVGNLCVEPDSGVFDLGPLVPCPVGSLPRFSCVPPGCQPENEGKDCPLSSGLSGVCCAGSCVDENADPMNCGSCGVSCASGYCQAGWGCMPAAVPQDCLQSCGPGTICANRSCVDGTCRSPGQAFYQATQPADEYCLAQDGTVGLCCQSGACAHLNSDPQNCGGCGVVCPSGQTCQSGLCNGVAACAAGHAGSYCNLDAGISYVCCPGTGCVDTSFDAQNCGACGASCASGQSCDGGSCTQG
jgi:hypothetical protein